MENEISKGKKTLFQDAEKLATRSGDEVGVMLFSPGGKPFSYGSTSIEEIIDKILKLKVEDHQRDHAESISIGFVALEDIHKELQALNEKERRRILMYKIMHPVSEIPSDKHMEERKVAMMLRVKKILNETKSAILGEHLKFDLNVVPEPEEDESS
ncbi:agamous-like MADS-box protein AGL29 [Solanum tuberosum]|uniref:agamous-like MADS-box protein AGL29 n=1 Tax=Solanum tuberosum TaxID=4113 RepID=UPI00073A4B4B|nr:PREDICTED: agamous-like MADS-box protein AGL29 [Solanum tuberosum]